MFIIFVKFGARISEHLPAPASESKGGSWGGLRIRVLVGLRLFELAGVRGRVQAGVGSIEVALLSVRIAGVSGVGIGRGTIVDCRGSLAVRMLASVGYGVGK